MSAPNFLPLDPENAHGCSHCQRAVFDMTINAYKCPHLGIVVSRRDYVAPNDCNEWLSAWMNDHKQHKQRHLKP
jgi:hypothetical protein